MDLHEKASPDAISIYRGRKLLNDGNSTEFENSTVPENVTETENCTEPAILDFPIIRIPGGYMGHLILPFIASIYLYILLARVCDDYFIASIKVICSKIGFSGDVAGATLMAAATSSPELFVNLVGTFITQGNIGIGTIIGSAVFNILAVPGLCSFFATAKVIKLDYWPLIRDSIVFCVSLFILCVVLHDGIIHWYEALLLVVTYASYIVMMHYNNIVRRKFEACFMKFKNNNCIWEDSSKWPLLNPNQGYVKPSNGHIVEEIIHDNDEPERYCCWPPESSPLKKIWWLFTWPITFLLASTIPNCKAWKRLYILTFVMCVCWIAIGSYLIAWMITISGYVLKIPDSVMGLTFIAAGMCIPETISSIIVSKQGEGSMALANSLGANIFDTLLCFGLPWLIKTTYFMGNSSDGHYMEVTASGLEYDTIILLVTLMLFFAIVAMNNFQLSKQGGYLCLFLYLIFIGCSVAIELNIFLTSQISPTCIVNFD